MGNKRLFHVVMIVSAILVTYYLYNVFASNDIYEDYIKKHGVLIEERMVDFESDQIVRVYKGIDNSWIQIVKCPGYQSEILLMVEMNDERITKAILLDEDETEGYGDYLHEEWFLNRLLIATKENAVLVKMSKKRENEIVAITGATISSEAVVDGLNSCMQNYGGVKHEKD